MDHEVALAHAISRIEEGLPTDRVIAEMAGMGAAEEMANTAAEAFA